MMFENTALPGFAGMETRRGTGSLWRGDPESTWGRVKKVHNERGAPFALPQGTVLKMDASGGCVPMTLPDIAADPGALPGPRLVIVADRNVTVHTGGAAVGVGICGEVDPSRLIVDGKSWKELTEGERALLESQLAVWGFGLRDVLQA